MYLPVKVVGKINELTNALVLRAVLMHGDHKLNTIVPVICSFLYVLCLNELSRNLSCFETDLLPVV